MPHYHHCAVCGVQVSVCSDDSCQKDETHPNYGKHYCSEHHPDPKFHVAATPPVSKKR
jgi:hypothetical protein